MKNSLNKTARWSTLVLAMGIMSAISVQGLAAINWPGGGGNNDTTKKSKDYKRGYKTGQQDCVKAPKDCKVLLEDVVANPGWGETEPNDNPGAADRLFLNRFYKGNSLDKFDRDWYYVGSLKPNQNLIINFLGDQANYTATTGWIVKVHDSNGNVIAAFDSTSTGPGNVSRPGDNPDDVIKLDDPILAKTPLSNAKIILVTLGNPGRYYISVETNDEDLGANRSYHIAAMISESNQVSPNPDTNFSDVETEINDTQETADPLRSNVHMFGVFGRKIVNFFTPPGPPEYEIGWFYKDCNPLNISTMPAGQNTCKCDTSNNPVVPDNPNIDTDPALPGIQPGPLPPSNACEARRVQVPGTGTDTGTWDSAFDYDNDWFKFVSSGNEQLKFEMCAKGTCDFTRVHLKVIYVNDSEILINTPITPGWTFDFGVVRSGTYFFELSPEPVDGEGDGAGNVDPSSGIHIVDDLTGPYNFVLRSTKLPPNGN